MINVTESPRDSFVTEFYNTVMSEPKLVLVWLDTQTSSHMSQLIHGIVAKMTLSSTILGQKGIAHDRACRLRVIYIHISVGSAVQDEAWGKINVDNVFELFYNGIATAETLRSQI